MEQVICPFCSNTDKDMIELLMVFRSVTGDVTVKYLCGVCSKEWSVKK